MHVCHLQCAALFDAMYATYTFCMLTAAWLTQTLHCTQSPIFLNHTCVITLSSACNQTDLETTLVSRAASRLRLPGAAVRPGASWRALAAGEGACRKPPDPGLPGREGCAQQLPRRCAA
jgi:hypothetical protein